MENKFCIKCKFEHNSDLFVKNRNYCRESRNKERSSKNNPVLIKEKKCSSCSNIKPISEFHKDRTQSDGLVDKCKICRTKDTSKFYENHKEDIKLAVKTYIKNNPEKIRKSRQKYETNLRKDNVLFKLKRNLRNRIWYGLQRKSWKKDSKLNNYLGCSLSELKIHIENQFKDDMSWDNYSSVWDIDHIIPYNYAKTQEELYKLSHYANLKPESQYYNRVIKRDNISPKDLYKIRLIENDLAVQIVKDEHYLERGCPAKYSFGLFDCFDIIKGVIIFTIPNSPHLKPSLINTDKDMLELSRVWLDDTAIKNSESFFVSECIKLTTYDYIVSFADPIQNHRGIIYQACNFWYMGLTQKTREYKIKGFEERSSHFKGQTADQLRLKYGQENVYLADRPQKHIYLYSKNKNKEELIKEIQEYP